MSSAPSSPFKAADEDGPEEPDSSHFVYPQTLQQLCQKFNKDASPAMKGDKPVLVSGVKLQARLLIAAFVTTHEKGVVMTGKQIADQITQLASKYVSPEPLARCTGFLVEALNHVAKYCYGLKTAGEEKATGADMKILGNPDQRPRVYRGKSCRSL